MQEVSSAVPPMLVFVGAVVALITGSVAAFFWIRRFLHLLRPICILPGVCRVFDGSGPDQITAKVTNVSGEDQVLVRCQALSAFPFLTGLRRFLRSPLIPPRLYPVVWYSAMTFPLMGDDPVRLMPKETRRFTFSLSNHPLCLFLTSELRIEVQTSTGQRFRSKRIVVPEPWRLKPSSPSPLLREESTMSGEQ